MGAAQHRNIGAILVPEHRRMGFLPRVFGERLMLAGENLVYTRAKFLSPDYAGGQWNYYDLSNGGFYMSPCTPERLRFQIGGNDFDGEMSADAAGIVITLYALNRLIWEIEKRGGDYDNQVIQYYALRD